MSVPFSLGDAADLVDRSIQKIWIKTSEEDTNYYSKYYHVETGITDYYTKDSSISGLGYASRILENAIITAQSPIQGHDKTYTQVHYGTLLSVTKKMWFFGIKKRELTQVASEARHACSALRELRCAERLDNSFESSYTAQDDAGNYTVTTTGGAGVAFISNAITREDAGTNNNNRITDGTTVNMDFEYDAIKAAHRTASALSPLKDPKGLPWVTKLDTIIVTDGHSNMFRAREILGALRRGVKPGSAERDGAGVPTYEVVEVPWRVGNTGHWHMFDSTKKNERYGFQYKESQPISLEGPNIVFKTKEIQLVSVAESKSFLINGESPEMDNPHQAGDSRAGATTEWRDSVILQGSDSLNTVYNQFHENRELGRNDLIDSNIIVS